MPSQLTAKYIQTPLGEVIAVFSKNGLQLLDYTDKPMLEKELNALKSDLIFTENCLTSLLENELDQYFNKQLTQFSVPLDSIGTPFQQKVWQLLLQIPYGKTISYKEQSERYSDPKAIRAIASANGKNKISILIPCHRVIGNNGKLTGYAGGIWRKKALLELEQSNLQKQLKLF
ncbi:methylated-DNA--[protein]-cysteine S-methyltransferase [Capnocytophaga sp.]|uniref:methylated-DNA--[protein]-cysteine S-methyltransferase n=1 Tax=Capnocytophaga sp. TaxID=44737 RepID=UPI0026DB3923|nr:methylated-DNA--[protein]-cysteine S-methyltransferase [Capnocytophaga sp.]MDO5104980.1 methylated-DNA--[protein]-cysteine S-methyltransferase [Capnocytophaga sp.]